MASLQILDQTNQPAGEMELDDRILEAAYHPKVVKQAVVGYLASIRQGTHSTKSRGEVNYSSRKLYRQKGTGNARAGSAKSPIRRHGGVTFGPTPRNHSTRMNKKMRRLALRSALAEKIRQNQVTVLENLELPDHKTRNLKQILDTLNAPKALIVTDELSENLSLAVRNLPDAHVISQRSLNVYELLRFPRVIILKDALEAMKPRLN